MVIGVRGIPLLGHLRRVAMSEFIVQGLVAVSCTDGIECASMFQNVAGHAHGPCGAALCMVRHNQPLTNTEMIRQTESVVRDIRQGSSSAHVRADCGYSKLRACLKMRKSNNYTHGLRDAAGQGNCLHVLPVLVIHR